MSQQRGDVGSAGRLGAGTGGVAGQRAAECEDGMKNDHECPGGGEDGGPRRGTGVWECSSWGHTYTGGAYSPKTPAGRTVTRSIRAALGEDAEE